jgi:ABC-2 type transport system ATP-binding protein
LTEAAEATAADLAVATYGLVRDYGQGAGLHGVDLAVPRKEVYGLIGPNGAGKTTLLSILSGLRRADSGRVEINLNGGRMAVCPDMPEFEPWLTAREVVRQSRALARVREKAGSGDDPVARVLEQVGLADAAGRRNGGFSRGMKQRLSLATALTLDPDLLILDEPSSALDPAGRAELFQLIAELAESRTVILSSHILDDVQRVAKTVGVLDRGRLLFQGPTQSLIDSYLRPAWNLRVRDNPAPLVEQLRELPWVTAVHHRPDGTVEVEATSAEVGERELPQAIAAAGTGLVSLTPVDATLESAFLALTHADVAPQHADADTVDAPKATADAPKATKVEAEAESTAPSTGAAQTAEVKDNADE